MDPCKEFPGNPDGGQCFVVLKVLGDFPGFGLRGILTKSEKGRFTAAGIRLKQTIDILFDPVGDLIGDDFENPSFRPGV